MHITFQDRAVRDICEQKLAAEKILSSTCASKLKNRLLDLRAAGCLADLPIGTPRASRGGNNEYVLDLADSFVLVFTPTRYVPKEGDTLDMRLSQIAHIKIMRIESGHE